MILQVFRQKQLQKIQFAIANHCPPLGSTTLPWKSSIPVWRSRMKKRKGWLALKSIFRFIIALLVTIAMPVAAAATVPSSSTSIIAFWITCVQRISFKFQKTATWPQTHTSLVQCQRNQLWPLLRCTTFQSVHSPSRLSPSLSELTQSWILEGSP